MHEYEFRLVVEHSSSLVPLLHTILQGKTVLERTVHTVFAKPHFRYRHRTWEMKRKLSTVAVYHDDVWFQWVHSLEIPFSQFSPSDNAKFNDVVGNYQNPFTHETRIHVQLDSRACLYAFRNRLVFEWEYGSFPEPVSNVSSRTLLEGLTAYRDVYTAMRDFSPPPYKLNDAMRKPVTCIEELFITDRKKRYKIAHKVDGVFGFVFSHKDYSKAKWEDFERRDGKTLGDGFVFAAEKCPSGIVLLDVYQVRGYPVAKWSRRAVFESFLPRLRLPDGYFVQHYADSLETLPDTRHPTDGYIQHDMVSDEAFKLKTAHSIDVVYNDGWFELTTNMRFRCREQLRNGYVYEVSMEGHVLRERRDRTTGNTPKQLEKIFECSPWTGPEMESFQPCVRKKRKSRECKKK